MVERYIVIYTAIIVFIWKRSVSYRLMENCLYDRQAEVTRPDDISLSQTDISRLPYKQFSDIHLEFREGRYIGRVISTNGRVISTNRYIGLHIKGHLILFFQILFQCLIYSHEMFPYILILFFFISIFVNVLISHLCIIRASCRACYW